VRLTHQQSNDGDDEHEDQVGDHKSPCQRGCGGQPQFAFVGGREGREIAGVGGVLLGNRLGRSLGGERRKWGATIWEFRTPCSGHLCNGMRASPPGPGP